MEKQKQFVDPHKLIQKLQEVFDTPDESICKFKHNLDVEKLI